MMTIEKLQTLRAVSQQAEENKKVVRIATCMATGGIAAGSAEVLDVLTDELCRREQVQVEIVRKGCVGMCRLDPLVDVFMPGQGKVTYVKMTREKMRRVIEEHIIGGQVVDEYTLHLANDLILDDYVVLEG